jgi:hypothetical protein
MKHSNKSLLCIPYRYNSGHPPEKEFLEKIKAIPGVSVVETQTITNMVI